MRRIIRINAIFALALLWGCPAPGNDAVVNSTKASEPVGGQANTPAAESGANAPIGRADRPLVSSPPETIKAIAWRDPGPDHIIAPYWFEPAANLATSRDLCIAPIRVRPDFSIELDAVIRVRLNAEPTPRALSDGSAPSEVLVAQDGYRLLVSGPALSKGNLHWAYQYELFSGNKGPFAHPLGGMVPTALMVHRDAVLIGSTACTVGRIDLTLQPGLENIFELADKSRGEQAERSRKSIDAFAQHGEYLSAVDNVVSPKFLFRLKVNQSLMVLENTKVSLGYWANTQLKEAAAADGVVAITGRFSHQSGYGNCLTVNYAAPRHSDSWGTDEFTAREFDRRFERKRPALCGGELTSWRGLAFFNSTIVIGAGTRGMLLVDSGAAPKNFVPTISPRKGACSDIRRVGDLLFSLELEEAEDELADPDSAPTDLVVWRWQDGKPTEARRHTLPVAARRLPR